jgi:ABC-type glycerol-3-phosphate transport system substrate-binding protein
MSLLSSRSRYSRPEGGLSPRSPMPDVQLARDERQLGRLQRSSSKSAMSVARNESRSGVPPPRLLAESLEPLRPFRASSLPAPPATPRWQPGSRPIGRDGVTMPEPSTETERKLEQLLYKYSVNPSDATATGGRSKTIAERLAEREQDARARRAVAEAAASPSAVATPAVTPRPPPGPAWNAARVSALAGQSEPDSEVARLQAAAEEAEERERRAAEERERRARLSPQALSNSREYLRWDMANSENRAHYEQLAT